MIDPIPSPDLRRSSSNAYHALLAVLATTFVAGPLTQGMGFGQRALDLLFLIVLVAGVAVSRGSRLRLWVALALGAFGAIATISTWMLDSQSAFIARSLAMITFFLFVFGSVVGHVLSDARVTPALLSGAASGYILLGMAWTFAYGLVDKLDPQAFKLIKDVVASESALRAPTFFYFSFTTITTLGYGDVLPVSPLARGLATLEAVAGQFYVAIVIAGLVGMHIARRGPRDQ